MSPDDQRFSKVRVTINRVYTKHGDLGTTTLVGQQAVRKDDERIETYGTIDELNSAVGLARVLLARASIVSGMEVERATLLQSLSRVQHELFNLGSLFATLPGDRHPRQPVITEEDVTALETEMDALNDRLPTLRSFVLPGSTEVSAHLHVARTVCRRAERRAVTLSDRTESKDPGERVGIKYLNRLSDAFFVWSRWVCVLEGADEVLWDPNKGAGAASV